MSEYLNQLPDEVETPSRFPPKAQDIFDREQERHDEDGALYSAWMATDERLATEVAAAESRLREIENHPNSKPHQIERARKAFEKARAKRDAARANRRSGRSLYRSVLDFSNANPGRYRDANTTDVLIDGKTDAEMIEHLRNELAKNRADVLVIESRPLPRDVWETTINKTVDREARYAPNARGTRNMRRVLRGAFGDKPTQGKVVWPMNKVYVGHGVYGDEIDTKALFFWLHGDAIKKKLLAQALEGFDPAEAMGVSERRERFEALEVERMQILRRLEFWNRRCEESGIQVKRDWPLEPLAFLDIEAA